MKIVHINTYDIGGAATSALRLHEGLLTENIDSFFLCLYKYNNNQPNKIAYTKPYAKQTIAGKIAGKLGVRQQTQAGKNEKLIDGLKGEFEIYSFPLTDNRPENHPILKDADIVHLHWVADFINYPSFFINIKQPVVWTFHDMNPFLGGFHYQNDKDSNKQNFDSVEKALIQVKTDAVTKHDNLTVVTPSKWLLESAQASNVFSKASFLNIPYGLNINVFKPYNTDFARTVFNLPHNKKIILFVSRDTDNYRKGFDIVLEAIDKLNVNRDILLVATGEGNSVSTEKIFSIGKITDERLMSILYSCADLVVIPSREDNLPNVMLEAFACGVPVLSFKVGGMYEFIEEGFNGFFAETISPESLAAALKDFTTDMYNFDKALIRDFAIQKFSLSTQALAYMKLYNDLIGKSA